MYLLNWNYLIKNMVCFYIQNLFRFFFLLVQDIVFQLHRFISALDKYHKDCNEIMKEADIFPIEVDLSLSTFHKADYQDDDDDENEQGDDNNQQQQTTDDIDLFDVLE